MEEVKIVCDETGEVQEPDIHDGYVVGIYAQGDAMVIRILPLYGKVIEFVLSGCGNMSVRDFGEWRSNIVLGIRIVPAADMNSATARQLCHRNEHEPWNADRFCAMAEEAGLVLVELAASMGASGLALCRSVVCRALPRDTFELSLPG